MFRTILLLSYLIPNVYLFIRIWQLFIPKEYRLWYVLIYAFLFSIYPLTRINGSSEPGLAVQVFESAANYILPFFLYLFLFILLIDILLLINLIIRIIPTEKKGMRSFRWKTLQVIILLSVLVVIGGIINFNTIRITEYRISVPGNSTKLTGLKVAFISDFHLEEGTPDGFVKRFVKEIEGIAPDLLLYGGDIVEGDHEDENMRQIEKLIGSITTKFGIYGVLGNHEHYAGPDVKSFFRNSGIAILCDSVVIIDNSFIVAGRNDSHLKTRKSIKELMGPVPDSLPVILMDHRPTDQDQIRRTTADVVFSGHTHHGQLFPINFITRSVYELSYGYMEKGNTHFFVSSGIRLWGPPVRTIAKSEILVVDLNFIVE